MKIEVGKVDPGVIPVVWPDVKEIVENFGARWLTTVDLSDVGQMVCRRQMDLWVATIDTELIGVLFASWESHRFESDYHINWLAGKWMDLWFDQGLEKLESYATMMGGTALVAGGRIGWARLLEPRGFMPVYTARKILHQTKGVH